MKIEMINLEKKKLSNINNKTKYILISNSYNSIVDYLDLKIKPLLIMYNGSYVVDLENNRVIISKSINNSCLNKIIKYSNAHNIHINYYKYNNVIYGLNLSCDNYHRRLIIPYMFKDLYPEVKCSILDKEIYVFDNKVSLMNAIEETLDYLNIKNNFIDLENIYVNVSDNKYCYSWKGYELYES